MASKCELNIILLLGDSGVGKTSIMVQYTAAHFDENFITTIGIDFKMKTIDIDGKSIKLQIWDTAEQESFHTITTSSYRDASSIILDITNSKASENIQQWIKRIDQHAPSNITRMLVGNKCDNTESREITEADAKSNINVDKIFYNMAVEIAKSMPNEEKNDTIKLHQQPSVRRPHRRC